MDGKLSSGVEFQLQQLMPEDRNFLFPVPPPKFNKCAECCDHYTLLLFGYFFLQKIAHKLGIKNVRARRFFLLKK